MSQPVVKIKKLVHFRGNLPVYQTPGSSGCDVGACLENAVELAPGERMMIPTGLSFEIPEGFEIQVRPRSGLAAKCGVSIVNTPGTIDSDYRGELKIILINLGKENFKINPQDRIAQLVVVPVIQAIFEESSEISETQRGAGGFGSTGL